jgi:hypothetical protein
MLRPFVIQRLGTCRISRRSRRGYSGQVAPGEVSSSSSPAPSSTEPSASASDAGTQPNVDSNISRLLNVLRSSYKIQFLSFHVFSFRCGIISHFHNFAVLRNDIVSLYRDLE